MTSAAGYAGLAIDLDGFKEVNDLRGHPVGDAVLMQTARRVLVSVRDSDLDCRTGDDEFVVVVAGDKLASEAIARRIV